jgi:hypothetical protein
VLYKPRFCCNCGEVIERADWTIMTSRRFCVVCASVQKHYDLLPRAVVALGIFAGFFGIWAVVGRPSKEIPRPQQLASARPVSSGLERPVKTESLNNAASTNTAVLQNAEVKPGPSRVPTNANSATVQQDKGRETVYFCGAATKKGTPCSRRVKVPGRCWQHLGQPAMVTDTRVLPSHRPGL